MCGICGIAWTEPDRPVERETLRRMTDILRHRGPDSDGFFAAPGLGLGFRRLSIIDLETGDQPIANEDGALVVVCNGEIYNYVELRRSLVASGHRFATRSDVEVVVHLYEEHGDDFLHHLRGMFALALWDARRRRLVLARDRLGIKPLHYAVTSDGLIFASEQKAILASGAVPPQPDIHALRQIFSLGRIVSPRTFVTGIRRMPAGHALIWADGRAELRQYWDATFPARCDYDEASSEREWAEALREKLTESVRLHLRSDVPLGTWLSGGIDSSAVTALVARLVAAPVNTFTLRFEESRFDELHGQRALDDHPQYRLVGHRIVCRRADMERLPRAIWHTEDALMAGVAIGQLMVAEATAARVKVVLTGEGSDELLGGYSWYPTMRILDPVFLLPSGVRRRLARLPALRRRWPAAAATIAGSRQMDFARFTGSITHVKSLAAAASLFSDDLLDRLGRDGDVNDAPPLPDGFESWHPFAQMQYFDIKHRMADAVVLGLDRTSMAHSVEARVPFLDHELVELCARIPPRMKMRWLREKSILRRAMSGELPAEIVWRKKRPMQVPIAHWLQEEVPAFAEEYLSEAALRDSGFFDAARVDALRRRLKAGDWRLGQILAAVLGVQIWHSLFRRGRFA